MKKARNILVVTLMLLSVLSFGSVANTYAKYTSTADLSDTAKVAKWDIELTSGTQTEKIWDAEANLSVTLFKDDIIAPGSEGSATIPTITNNSEVDATYSITFSELKNDSGIPLEYYDAKTGKWKGIDDVTPITGTIAQGDTVTLTDAIKWRWAYYVDDTQDGKDTDLGKDAALATDEDGIPKIELSLSITATQAAPVVTP